MTAFLPASDHNNKWCRFSLIGRLGLEETPPNSGVEILAIAEHKHTHTQARPGPAASLRRRQMRSAPADIVAVGGVALSSPVG